MESEDESIQKIPQKRLAFRFGLLHCPIRAMVVEAPGLLLLLVSEGRK